MKQNDECWTRFRTESVSFFHSIRDSWNSRTIVTYTSDHFKEFLRFTIIYTNIAMVRIRPCKHKKSLSLIFSDIILTKSRLWFRIHDSCLEIHDHPSKKKSTSQEVFLTYEPHHERFSLKQTIALESFFLSDANNALLQKMQCPGKRNSCNWRE